MPAVLRINLLGGFSLYCEDVLVTALNTPRLQSLITYLILHRDVPQSRQHLAFLLWPNSTEAQARTNLRHLFHQLRQAVPQADAFLRATANTVQWRADAPFTLDVDEFERACAAGGFDRAVKIYRGELLPECYDDWILPERERWRQLFGAALDQLVRQKEEAGEYAAAIEHAQRLLRHDPVREEAYCTLMRLYSLRGDRTGIVRIYEMCAAVLRQELDVKPSPGTQAAYRRYLAHSIPVEERVHYHREPQADRRRSNLPCSLTRLIGREREKRQVQELVLSHRMLTLIGAGGVGKTRLALATAEELLDRFADGVWLVDFASLADTALVVQAAAAVLGVRDEMGLPLLARLTDYLYNKQLLIVLDNCEHVDVAVRSMAQTVLQVAPNVRMLATSRVVLGVAGEVTWRVPPLSAPDMSRRRILTPSEGESTAHGQDLAQALRRYDSVQFFVDRAAAVLPTFALTDQNARAVGQICQQLDGIPLALELAAARVRVLSVQQIAEHLENALQLLTQNGPMALSHHQTLQATQDWSHALLTHEEQVLFRRLAVFAGGATFEAVEDICSGDGIAKDCLLNLVSNLVDKSLVSVDAVADATRFRLHEVARQYAHIKLIEAGEEAQLRNRHLDFFCRLAEALEPDLRGTTPPGAISWLTQEQDNLRVALEWSAHEHGDAQHALRLVAALFGFWEICGLLTKERNWLEALLTRGSAAASTTLRAKALRAAGQAAYYQCDFEAARSFFEQSLALDRELDNKPRLADTLSRLGLLWSVQYDYAAAKPFYEESLAISRSLDDPPCIAETLSKLGYMVFRQGDCLRARSLLEESLTLFREPADAYSKARALYFLGHVSRFESDYTKARSLYTQSLTILKESANSWGMFYALEGFGYLAVAEGQFERATRLFGAAERLAETIGTSIVPTERVEHERNVAAARAALGEAAFAAAWDFGRDMTLDEAVAYALEQTQP